MSRSRLLDIRAARRLFTTPEGKSFAALDGVDLAVDEGEFVTLLGPSGCGKTTLLRAIAGFEELDEGVIRLDGADLSGLPPHRRPVNTVFQSYALFPHMSVARNVGYALEVQGAPRAEREAEVAAALEKVGLAGLGTRRPAQLSGGQRQRVALARAIVAKPRLLLLDEPLSALDRNLRQQMQFELKDLQHRLGIAFVFVTHDQEEALTMSDRIVVLRAGKVEQAAPPREIYRHPKTRFVAEFIGETNLLPARVEGISGAQALLSLPGGQSLQAEAAGLEPGRTVTAVLRPTDITLGTGDLAGTLLRADFMGADRHLRVALEGGPEISVIARDTAVLPQPGTRLHLGCDPALVHVMEEPT